MEHGEHGERGEHREHGERREHREHGDIRTENLEDRAWCGELTNDVSDFPLVDATCSIYVTLSIS